MALARELDAGRLPADSALIKRGDRRSVWALPQVAEGVLLKHFRVRGWEPLLFLLRRSRGAAEFHASVHLARLGVATPEAVGFGERRQAGLLRESWSMARLVPRAVTVGEALETARASHDEAASGRLARAAVATAAELHRLPVLHRDLHANNLLIGANGSILVIDLHSLRPVARLTRPMRMDTLARLVFSMRGAIDLSRSEPFAAEYARHSGEAPAGVAADLSAALEAFERSYVAGRTARCLVRSTLFTPERLAEGRVFHRREYSIDQLRRDVMEHDQIVRESRAGLLGATPRARVSRVHDAAGSRIVKEYLRAGPAPRLRHWLRRGRARTAWVGSRRLEVLGILTPQALALVERSDGSAVVVTRAVEGAVTLRAWLSTLRDDPRPRERRWLAAALGHLVGRLARAGLQHDDLSTKNLLVSDDVTPPARDRRDAGGPEWPGLHVIDLDNLRTVQRHDPKSLIRMLTQIGDVPAWVSRGDRQRFARAYALAAGQPLTGHVISAATARARERAGRRAGLEHPRSPLPASAPGLDAGGGHG